MCCVISSSQTNGLSWLRYFLQNGQERSPLPWNDSTPLTQHELTTITRSIQAFQLGECSEGVNLMRLARHHARQTGDRHWVEAIRLFIGEEQRHAHDLKHFMELHHIPLVRYHWSDALFRKLRRLVNLEVALTVLLTAELVATLYYPALGEATRSPLLNALCAQIYHDEVQHVVFQTENLALIRAKQPAWRSLLADKIHQLFFRLTLLVVWAGHGPVFLASGYRFHMFYEQACEALRATRQAIQVAQQAKRSVNTPRS